jgi:hypothetical protein
MNANRNLKVTTYVALALAVLVAIWFEQSARGFAALRFDWISIWVASPFFAMALSLALAPGANSVKVILLLSVLLAAFGFFVYREASSSADAQSGLIFIFLPLYQLGVVLLVFIGVIIARVRSQKSANNSLKSDVAKPRALG